MRNRSVASIATGLGLFCSCLYLTVSASGQSEAKDGAPKAAAPVKGKGGFKKGPAGPSKPTPRLPDGKVDFGGKGVWAPRWIMDWSGVYFPGVDKKIDVPFTEWGAAKLKERRANDSRDDPQGYCLPAGVPRYTGTPYPFQMIQLPDRLVIIYEGSTHMYRVILMDGRKHTEDPNPTWLGESIGWWEGNDAIVVDSVGFNGRTWLDYAGHPTTEKLHVIEKFTRPDFNTLKYEVTIEDPTAYTRPWTSSFTIPFREGWELMEYVCAENNRDLLHLGTKVPQ